ncbi:MAG TPA: MlaD family protein, partial [Rhizobacter sp.]|nr:MlaD family protein [Rhizobacter sp.]
MTENNDSDPVSPPAPAAAPTPSTPAPVVRKWHGPSLVWLVPIIALAVGVSLVIRSLMSAGPQINIDFRSADGVRPGKTEVRYKEVVIGRVEGVALSKDSKRVHVT